MITLQHRGDAVVKGMRTAVIASHLALVPVAAGLMSTLPAEADSAQISAWGDNDSTKMETSGTVAIFGTGVVR
ncbi:hypothetical protein AB0392_54435 [Nonomuraea angiospora]|uniref:hypothetical protein n=1 Tax=Nonomuraea angiospora TaxID=46172 RepID=UPI00344F3D42